MTEVITGLSPAWESVVATTLELASGVTVTRRCADVAELVSVAEAGIGQCAVVSADLRGLDLSLVRRLEDRGMSLVGLYPAGDDAAERRLRQLGVRAVLSVDADAVDFSTAIREVTERGRPAGPMDLPGDALVVPDAVPAEFAPSVEPRWTGGPGGNADPQGVVDQAGVTAHSPSDRLAPVDAESGWQPRGARPGDSAADAPAARSTVIAVWGPTGAPGRTTVAVNLAAELASRAVEVVLVDADTYGGCVAQALGLLDEAPGIAAACRAADNGSLDLPVLARLAPLVTPGLRVLTGLPKADRWPEIRAAAFERALELSRELAPVVVIDCGFCIEDDEELSYDTSAPRRNEATLTALSVADTLLAVGGADPVALQRYVRALQELGSVPSPQPVPVINRVRSTAVGAKPEERIADSLARFAALEGVRFLANDPEVVDAALLAGRSVVEHAPDSALRAGITDLATAVAPWTRTRSGARRRGWRRRATAGALIAGPPRER